MGRPFISLENVSFSYEEEGGKQVLKNINLQFEKGSFTAILGHNGSGKSTLAKLINSILLPDAGKIYVDGLDVADENLPEEELFSLRRKVGMVFQNPDTQLVATVVEEDVAFGPENLGIPPEEIRRRVDEAMALMGISEYARHSPAKLSGGQKQRVAIAGVVAMRPSCIVLDEPTAMLDPNGRKEVLKAVSELNKKENVTVVLITHYMEEVIHANKVYVMDGGNVVMQGTPREIFSQVETLKKYRLDVPQVTLLAHELHKAGVDIPEGILTKEELVGALCR